MQNIHQNHVDLNWNANQAPSKPVRKQKRRQQEGDARFRIKMHVTNIMRMMILVKMMMMRRTMMMMIMVEVTIISLAGLRPLPIQAPPATVPQVLDFR